MDEIQLPELQELSGEQLDELAAAVNSDFEELAASDDVSDETIEALESLSAIANDIKAEKAGRLELAAKAAKKDALLAEFNANKAETVELAEEDGEDDEEVEPGADDDDAEAEQDEADAEPTPTTTPEESAVTTEAEDTSIVASVSPKGLKVPADFAPVTSPSRLSMTAAADVPGLAAGHPIDAMGDLVSAFMKKAPNLGSRGQAGGDGARFLIASAEWDAPDALTLGDDAGSNIGRINGRTSTASLVAAGGLCAPIEPYYQLEVVAGSCRPVRSMLPTFRASRGGIKFQSPPTLSDTTAGITVVSAACDNATPCSNGVGPIPCKDKACIHVCCGTETDALVQAISRCVTFGNFAARTYPEQVEAWLQLSMASHARTAEVALLDGIKAGSVLVTAAAKYGASITLLTQIDRAVAAYKSRHRVCNGVKLRALFPEWVTSLLRSDLASRNNDALFNVTDAMILDWFRTRGLEPAFYIDGATGGGQVWGAQTAGALLSYPSTVQWALFSEGTFLFLDGGTLDIGLVRDSQLNSRNDYSIFSETFEGIAKVGLESLWITSTVAADGTAAPAAAAALAN